MPSYPLRQQPPLASLQLNVTSGQGPQLTGGLSLGLNDLNGTGRLSLGDLASTSAYTLSLNASADVDLHFDANFGGNTNLPHLSTDFYFTWSTNPTPSSPDTLGFTDVTLDLGGFIDSVASQIGSVLAPIEPLVEVLTTPLPVLSQLAGHNIDLVDLASTLGFCSPSTADFINAVATFLSDGVNVPDGIDLGSFTLDPNAAMNPASLGTLAPASTQAIPHSGSADDANTIPGFSDPHSQQSNERFPIVARPQRTVGDLPDARAQLELPVQSILPDYRSVGCGTGRPDRRKAQFSFGFDTTGFQQFAADNFRDPSLILDGFYVSDRANPDGTGPVTPQAQLSW